MEKCWRKVLGEAVGEESCREILRKSVIKKLHWEKVLGKNVVEK